METIFFGLLFIFLRINISFIDLGIIYYLSNALGYCLILVGISRLEITYQKLSKLKPLIIVMIFHSVIFFILNLTNYSPLMMPLSSTIDTFIAISGLVIVIVGMIIVYYIIHFLIETLKDESSLFLKLRTLEQLNNVMTFVFIISGILFFFTYFPMLAGISIIVMLALNGYFLYYFYSNFVIDKWIRLAIESLIWQKW